MNQYFIHLIFCLISVNIANATDRLPIYKNQLLSKARISLLRDGWKPYVTLDMTNKLNEVGLTEREYIHAGYIEVGNCGASTPYCEFNYRKNEKCLHVVAGGDEDKIIKETISKWSYTCK